MGCREPAGSCRGSRKDAAKCREQNRGSRQYLSVCRQGFGIPDWLPRTVGKHSEVSDRLPRAGDMLSGFPTALFKLAGSFRKIPIAAIHPFLSITFRPVIVSFG